MREKSETEEEMREGERERTRDDGGCAGTGSLGKSVWPSVCVCVCLVSLTYSV